MLNRLKLIHKMFMLPLLAGIAVLVIFITVQTSNARTARLVERIDDGYIPKIDHSVSSDISFENYVYFRRTLQEMLEG